MKYQEDIKEHCYVVRASLPTVTHHVPGRFYSYEGVDSGPQRLWCEMSCNGAYSYENFIDFGLWFFATKTDAIRFKLTWT